jgi:hypothetical protein
MLSIGAPRFALGKAWLRVVPPDEQQFAQANLAVVHMTTRPEPNSLACAAMALGTSSGLQM